MTASTLTRTTIPGFTPPLPDGDMFTAIRLARAAHTPAGGPRAINASIRTARRLNNTDAKIVAVLQNILNTKYFTADDLHRYGFNPAIIEAVETFTTRPNETTTERLTRITGNPLAEQVLLAN